MRKMPGPMPISCPSCRRRKVAVWWCVRAAKLTRTVLLPAVKTGFQRVQSKKIERAAW